MDAASDSDTATGDGWMEKRSLSGTEGEEEYDSEEREYDELMVLMFSLSLLSSPATAVVAVRGSLDAGGDVLSRVESDAMLLSAARFIVAARVAAVGRRLCEEERETGEREAAGVAGVDMSVSGG
jgi:hypothetical protein